MRKKLFVKGVALATAIATAVAGISLPAYAGSKNSKNSEVTKESVDDISTSDYTILTDENGEVYDLGGMTVTIRDWWSTGVKNDENSEYDKAYNEYIDWIQDTYNFKLKRTKMGDWGTAEQDLITYTAIDGDKNNYIFTLQGATVDTLSNVAYDLSTLSCLDFSKPQYNRTSMHKATAYYGMNGDIVDPRVGIYFNKSVLHDAGINPDDIYTMQKKGTWTWSEFEKLLKKTTRDTDEDGEIDVWGIVCNEVNLVEQAVISNGASMVTTGKSGLVYNLESKATKEALDWVYNVMKKYDTDGGLDEDGNAMGWDYYRKMFVNGEAAFCCDFAYMSASGGDFDKEAMGEELGYVAFPKGTSAKNYYVDGSATNTYVIPACYSKERAWKIAFVYDLYTTPIKGYENYCKYTYSTSYNIDSKAYKETMPILTGLKSTGNIDFQNSTLDYVADSTFIWLLGPNTTMTMNELIASARDTWKDSLLEYNQYFKNRAPQYTVKFELNGHGETIAAKKVLPGGAVSVANPSEDGYRFAGWYSDSDLTKPYSTYKSAVKKNITLYAKWIKTDSLKASISKKEYAYTGKAVKPTVTVKDGNGNKISKSLYTVKYNKNTNVGTATATVTFSGKYKNNPSINLTYTILPQATAIEKLATKKSGRVTVYWDDVMEQTNGYIIEYSTTSNFKSFKSVTVKDNGICGYTIANLKGGQKLYFRVRTYSTVDGENLVSAASKAVSITVKSK